MTESLLLRPDESNFLHVGIPTPVGITKQCGSKQATMTNVFCTNSHNLAIMDDGISTTNGADMNKRDIERVGGHFIFLVWFCVIAVNR